MKEITQEKNPINVNNVVKPTDIRVPYEHTKGLTQDRNNLNVSNVVELSFLL